MWFPKGKLTPQDVLAFLTQGTRGGTGCDAALGWDLGVLQEQAFRTADLVLITGGECDGDDQTLAAREHLRRTRDLQGQMLGVPEVDHWVGSLMRDNCTYK